MACDNPQHAAVSAARPEERASPAPPAAARRGRGLSLFSGGLASQLAIAVLREQGALVEAVTFESPFFKTAATRRAAAALGVQLHAIDFTADILELLRHPPHGFGGGLNPCIDCHARMLRRAGELMERLGYDFLATGEVLNQRPMSQTRRSLEIVRRDSAYEERVIRPLSAQLLEPSAPERAGLVDRARLLALNGRSRRAQMELARRYGLRDYPAPAGGCLLCEKGFCARLKDLMAREGLGDARRVRLLTIGRCLRLPGGAMCHVGRHQRDNAALEAAAAANDILLDAVAAPGPTLLLPDGAAESDLALARGICAAYSDGQPDQPRSIRARRDGREETRVAAPLPRARIEAWMLK